MFTGIVSGTGQVTALELGTRSARISIAEPGTAARLAIGASVAVDGCCLTVTELDPPVFHVQAVPETLARTTLGGLEAGSRVNLELPVEASGRLDGHILQGHVDGVARVARVEAAELGREVTFQVPRPLLRYVALKGSIGLDGMSLTVAGLDDEAGTVRVAFIPHTLRATKAGAYVEGAPVNVEVDVVARYVERILEARGGLRPGAGDAGVL